MHELNLKNIAAGKFHPLLSETASKAQRKWLACFEIIFAVGIKPAFWHERVWVVEIIFVMSDSPRACVDFSLCIVSTIIHARDQLMDYSLPLVPSVHQSWPQDRFVGTLATQVGISSALLR